MIKLIQPNEKYKLSVLESIEELKEDKSNAIDWYYKVNNDFITYVNDLVNRKNIKTDKLVPETILWAIKNEVFVGRISIRHELNENLTKVGGHIGYEVRPTYRRQGIATKMLNVALPVAKGVGISSVLLTCDDDNIGSIKTIESQGGILENKIFIADGKPMKRRYWIKL